MYLHCISLFGYVVLAAQVWFDEEHVLICLFFVYLHECVHELYGKKKLQRYFRLQNSLRATVCHLSKDGEPISDEMHNCSH